jgi:hypothetical protein
VNRAKEAEIFTANQMYVSKFINQAAKLLDKVTPADWGIKKSFSTLVNEASTEIRPYPERQRNGGKRTRASRKASRHWK